jgi:hypothetical protein
MRSLQSVRDEMVADFPGIDEKKPGLGPRHTRGETRDSMFLVATVRREGPSQTTVRVRNLSAGGMMGETAEYFRTGEILEIDLRGIGRVAGRIAWVAPQRVGIAFAKQIDPRLARRPVGNKDSNSALMKPVTGMRRTGLKLDLD